MYGSSEVGQYPLSVSLKMNITKFWTKIINSDYNQLIWIVYNAMMTIVDYILAQPNVEHVILRNYWNLPILDILRNRTKWSHI